MDNTIQQYYFKDTIPLGLKDIFWPPIVNLEASEFWKYQNLENVCVIDF